MGNIFINPLSDGGFKHIFGIEGKSEQFLLDFLNGIFKDDPSIGHIVSVRYLNTEQPSGNVYDKEIRYDLHCVTSSGHRFIIEMQRDVRPNFIPRAVYYVARATAQQLMYHLGTRRNYTDLMPVVGLFIIESHLHDRPQRVILDYRFSEKDDPKDVIGLSRMVFVQLDYFTKTESECKDAVDQWLYILKHLNIMDYMPFREVRDKVFDRLDSYARLANLSEPERQEYEHLLKFYLDYINDKEFFEAKGRAEGEAKGRAEGEAKGRAEGEREKAMAIAKSLIKSGMSLEKVIEYTGINPTDL